MRCRNRRKWSLQDWDKSGNLVKTVQLQSTFEEERLDFAPAFWTDLVPKLTFKHQTLRWRPPQLGLYIYASLEVHPLTAHAFQMPMSSSPKYAYHAFWANHGLHAINLVASATHWIIDLEGSVIRYASLYPDHAFKCSCRKSRQKFGVEIWFNFGTF